MKPLVSFVRCPNRHHYDSLKYDTCPQCKAKEAKAAAKMSPAPQEAPPVPGEMTYQAGEYIPTQHIPSNQLPVRPETPDDRTELLLEEDDRTLMLFDDSEAPTEPQSQEEDDRTLLLFEDVPAGAAQQPDTFAKADDNSTIAIYDVDGQMPVVGWLVCVRGEHTGESFALKAGQNFIGRSPDMDVYLEREMSVSRERHAVILFEPDKGEFYLMPGHSNGLTYHNDKVLTESVQLSAYDRLRLGKSLYMFIPFCGERFSWNTYLGSE